MIRIAEPAKHLKLVTRVTPAAATVTGVTWPCCPACGQRLPAQTKAAAKQKAYRERRKARG